MDNFVSDPQLELNVVEVLPAPNVLASPSPVGAKSSNNFFCVRFECPHHLMVSLPLNLHSQKGKVPFVSPCYLPKFWGKKPKATTKMTLNKLPNMELLPFLLCQGVYHLSYIKNSYL